MLNGCRMNSSQMKGSDGIEAAPFSWQQSLVLKGHNKQTSGWCGSRRQQCEPDKKANSPG